MENFYAESKPDPDFVWLRAVLEAAPNLPRGSFFVATAISLKSNGKYAEISQHVIGAVLENTFNTNEIMVAIRALIGRGFLHASNKAAKPTRYGFLFPDGERPPR